MERTKRKREFCPSGKTRYETGDAAQAALGGLYRAGRWNRRDARRANAYRCGRCGYWHVGHDGHARRRLLVGGIDPPGVPPRAEWDGFLPSAAANICERGREPAAPPTRTTSGGRAMRQRVVWTEDEMVLVLDRAAELAAAGRHRSLRGLVLAAQEVLAADRRRNFASASYGNLAWLVDGLAARGLWREDGPGRPPGPEAAAAETPMAAVAADPPAAAFPLFDPAPPAPAPDLREAIATILDAVAGDRGQTHSLLRAVLDEMQATRFAVDALYLEVQDLRADLRERAAPPPVQPDITSPPAMRPTPKATPPPPPVLMKLPAEPAEKSEGPQEVTAAADERSSIRLQPPAPRADRPKIVLVGYIRAQCRSIIQEVGRIATVIELDSRKLKGTLPAADYYILSSHNRHYWWEKAIAAVGRDRVIRMDSTGVNTTCEEIRRIAREHRDAGRGPAAATN